MITTKVLTPRAVCMVQLFRDQDEIRGGHKIYFLNFEMILMNNNFKRAFNRSLFKLISSNA